MWVNRTLGECARPPPSRIPYPDSEGSETLLPAPLPSGCAGAASVSPAGRPVNRELLTLTEHPPGLSPSHLTQTLWGELYSDPHFSGAETEVPSQAQILSYRVSLSPHKAVGAAAGQSGPGYTTTEGGCGFRGTDPNVRGGDRQWMSGPAPGGSVSWGW